MSCIFTEIQACENKRISGCLRILNTMSRKKRIKNFLPRYQKKISKKSIFVMKI